MTLTSPTELFTEVLPAALAATLAPGWTLDVNGVLLLRSQRVASPRPASQDDVGWEAFWNHVHIPDRDLPQTDRWHALLWRRALAYAYRGLFTAAEILTGRECLAVIALGDNMDGATVRFHVRRPGIGWVTDDLDGYEPHAVSVVSSDDLPPRRDGYVLAERFMPPHAQEALDGWNITHAHLDPLDVITDIGRTGGGDFARVWIRWPIDRTP